jgi:hypothetical protein
MMREPAKQVELVFITSIMKSHENAHVTRMINNKTYEYGHVLGAEDRKNRLPRLMQNNVAYLLNCRDEVWNQSLVERKLEFEIVHVRNNAKNA